MVKRSGWKIADGAEVRASSLLAYSSGALQFWQGLSSGSSLNAMSCARKCSLFGYVSRRLPELTGDGAGRVMTGCGVSLTPWVMWARVWRAIGERGLAGS